MVIIARLCGFMVMHLQPQHATPSAAAAPCSSMPPVVVEEETATATATAVAEEWAQALTSPKSATATAPVSEELMSLANFHKYVEQTSSFGGVDVFSEFPQVRGRKLAREAEKVNGERNRESEQNDSSMEKRKLLRKEQKVNKRDGKKRKMLQENNAKAIYARKVGDVRAKWAYFASQSEAARQLAVEISSIGRCCRGTLLTAGGYQFKLASSSSSSDSLTRKTCVLTCSRCNRKFDTSASLAGHRSWCGNTKRTNALHKKAIYARKVGDVRAKWAYFASQSEAARQLAVEISSIGRCCRGTLLTAGGYQFKLASSSSARRSEDQVANIKWITYRSVKDYSVDGNYSSCSCHLAWKVLKTIEAGEEILTVYDRESSAPIGIPGRRSKAIHNKGSAYKALKKKYDNSSKRIKCDHCDFRTNLKSSLTRHIVKNRCASYLSKAVNSKMGRKVAKTCWSLDELEGEKPFKCPACDYGGQDKFYLLNHFIARHGKGHAYDALKEKFEQAPKRLKCDHCDFRTNLKGSLTRHVESRVCRSNSKTRQLEEERREKVPDVFGSNRVCSGIPKKLDIRVRKARNRQQRKRRKNIKKRMYEEEVKARTILRKDYLQRMYDKAGLGNPKKKQKEKE